MAVLQDRRVVTGSRQLLVWDPAKPGTAPVEFGRHEGVVGVSAVAVLPDGRMVTGLRDGRVLVQDPAKPGTAPIEFRGHEAVVAGSAVAVLPDGRMVTSDRDGLLLVWDPAEPGTSPVELGRYESRLTGVAVLPDGRVVAGSADRRVLLWNVQSTSPGTSLACPVQALTTSLSPYGTRLFIGHGTEGISCWEIRPARQNTPEPSAT